MNKSKPIVFFGSGPVAAESLRLLAKIFTIEAVVTKPRAAHHRGDVPVLSTAEDLKLRIETVTDRKTLDSLFATDPFASDLAILIDFGIIVSQRVIDYFPLGIINSHFSLLPEWRGADPITFSILSGQKTTGVSLMLLSAGMDEGPLLADTSFTIPPDMTTAELTQALIQESYQTIKTMVPLYIDGKANPAPQEVIAKMAGRSQTPTYSRKIAKKDGVLDWTKPAEQLEREIRAFGDWPKSHTKLKGIDVIITKAHVVTMDGLPGVTSVVDRQLVVACGSHSLCIDSLKPAGKKEMTSQAFLAGHNALFKNI